MVASFGRYEILEKIGSGSQGEVFRARDTVLNRVVALKVLHESLASDTRFIERLRREAQLIAALDNHPNIVNIYDLDTDWNPPFISMEYLPQSLENVLARDGLLSLEDVLAYAAQIADGLSAAHQQGVIHRNIRPGNILISTDGVAKVTDFGLARSQSVAGANQNAADSAGVNIGTPVYWSPEQIRDQNVDQRSDVYSFGCLLYQLLTSKVPFEGDSDEVIRQHIESDPPRVREVRPEVPKELEEIILKAMEKGPEDRYQHISQLTADLQSVGKDKTPGLSVPPSPSRKRYIWYGLAAILVVAVGLTAFLLTRTQAESRPPLASDSGLITPEASTPKTVLVVAERDSSLDADFIGEGTASLTAPQELPSARSVNVTLELSLLETFATTDVEFVIRQIHPVNVIKQPDDPNAPPLATFVYNNLPVYSSMRARLDAPAFRYDQIDWIERNMEGGNGRWTWNILPVPGVTGPQEITVQIEAKGVLQATFTADVLVRPVENIIDTPTPVSSTLVPATPSSLSPTVTPTAPLIALPPLSTNTPLSDSPTPTPTATPPSPSPTPIPTLGPVADSITEPSNGDRIQREITVKGIVSEPVREGWFLWVVVESESDWFPQATSITPELNVETGQLEWETAILIGEPEDEGKSFAILSVLAPRDIYSLFNRWLSGKREIGLDGAEMRLFGAEVQDRVFVVRR